MYFCFYRFSIHIVPALNFDGALRYQEKPNGNCSSSAGANRASGVNSKGIDISTDFHVGRNDDSAETEAVKDMLRQRPYLMSIELKGDTEDVLLPQGEAVDTNKYAAQMRVETFSISILPSQFATPFCL